MKKRIFLTIFAFVLLALPMTSSAIFKLTIEVKNRNPRLCFTAGGDCSVKIEIGTTALSDYKCPEGSLPLFVPNPNWAGGKAELLPDNIISKAESGLQYDISIPKQKPVFSQKSVSYTHLTLPTIYSV